MSDDPRTPQVGEQVGDIVEGTDEQPDAPEIAEDPVGDRRKELGLEGGDDDGEAEGGEPRDRNRDVSED